ncbi:MAG: alkaline phosphatase family protein [Thermoanaerobaculia bacterium]
MLLVLPVLSCRQEPERAATSNVAAPAAEKPALESVEASDSTARSRRAAGGRPPVIWLGMDGLDWGLLDRLVAEGRMPNWKRLTAGGYSARLQSFMPILSPVVWTTVATGAGPDVHRVLDFQEVDPETGQRMPISGRSRAVPALWNIASASGRSVGVVGWWATHPAEEVAGFFVSDHASPILFEGLSRTGAAYPASLQPVVEQIVARDGRVGDEELGRFVDLPLPEIARARSSGAGLKDPIIALDRILGATRIQQRIARELYDRKLPDLLMVYFEGTDAIAHVFAPFVPPRMDCVSQEDFGRYRHAVDDYYALVDRILGQWMRRAEEDGATLIVNSDHGFKWGEDRPCERSSLNPSTAAYWHRIEGVFAAYGARVRKSAQRGSASVFDLAPTVAALLELPVDRTLTGRVVRAGFLQIGTPPRKDLFGTVAVRRLAAEAMSEKETSEYAQRLHSLGYLSGGEPAKFAPTGGGRPGLTEGGWNNLGLYLREVKANLPAAEAAFQKALELRPGYASPLFNLAVLYGERNDDRKAIDYLFRACEAGHADPEGTILHWASKYREKGKAVPTREILEGGARQYPANEAIGRELGLLRFMSRQCPAAYEAVSRFEASSREPLTLNALGLFQTCLGHREEADRLFHRSLAINPDQPAVVRSLDILSHAPPQRGRNPAAMKRER